MKSLAATTDGLFLQISNALALITAEQYSYKNSLLGNASVGQHIRHVVELFQQMISGYTAGEINYENRQRNFLIETDKIFAVEQLNIIANEIDLPNKNLLLTADYTITNDDTLTIITNYHREVIYNVEHCIHHMALIRIAFQSAFGIMLPEDFAVAPSTLKYRKACAQ
jgi:hypothetical protein